MSEEARKQALLELARRELARRQQPAPTAGQQARDIGMSILDNVVGFGEIDTPGERFGATIRDGINAMESGARSTLATFADMPGILSNLMASGAARGAEAMGVPAPVAGAAQEIIRRRGPFGSGTSVRDAVNAATGDSLNYEPQTQVGRYSRTVGEFLPGAGGGFLPYALVPGVLSEAAGQATEGMTFPERLPVIGGSDVEPYARTGSALIGPTVYNAARGIITPNPADPARVAAANRLNAEGINTTAGQRTGNRGLTFREEAATRTGDVIANQDEQFTAAALRRINARDPETLGPATRATPEVLRQAKKDIGELFDEVAEGVSFKADNALVSSMDDAAKTYANMTNKAQSAPIVTNTLNKIKEALRTGQPISGRQYQAWRSELSEATVGGGALGNAAQRYIDALDDAVERSLTDPDLIAKYGRARQEWRDFLAIRNAVSMAGENTAAGIISPRQMRGQVASGSGRSSYATGQRDLGNLTRDANAVLPRITDPQQDRLMARAATDIAGSGGVSGGLAFALTQDPQIAAMAGAGGILAPVLANRAVGSPVLQRYLANQLVTGRNAPMSSGLMASALSGLLNQ
jgi:hypothetical protein